MIDNLEEDDLNILYSEDDSEVYVVTESSARLKLESEPRPELAPLYMDLETGEAVHPEEISPNQASTFARYAIKESSAETFFSTTEDEERWREEFSGLFDQAPESFDTRDTELDGSTAKRSYPY